MKWLVIMFVLIASLFMFGCTDGSFAQDDTNYDALLENEKEINSSLNIELETVQDNLALANTSIIELQESNEYLRKQKDASVEKFDDIEGVYSALFTDAVNCYYANLCSYDEVGCVESLKDIYPGYTANDLYVLESDWCDGMYRDWDLYQSFDVELQDGE